MKIAYVVNSFYAISETFIRDLVLGLLESGEDVQVLCDRESGKTATELKERVTVCGWLTPSLPERFVTIALRRLGPWGRWLSAAFAQWNAVGKLSKRLPTDCNVVYVEYGSVAVSALPLLKKRGKPFVVHFHGYDITAGMKDPFYASEMQKVFQHASALIANTHHLKRLLILAGADPKKVEMIPMSVECAGVEPMSWEERKKAFPSAVFLGRMTAKKNPVALIESFHMVHKQLPDARLSLIGDGPELPRVRKRIQARGLEEVVTIHGALPQREALDIVNQNWLYVQHSCTPLTGDQESFGLSLAEAALLELPVVSTLHNGIPENVVDGVTGLLCREYDYETMAENMLCFLKNPELSEEFGKKGFEHVKRSFRKEERVSAILKTLEKWHRTYEVPLKNPDLATE